MPQEDYHITWHTYSDHLKEMMSDLRTFGSYTDVTLISDDKKQSKAHRTILSACSPVLKNILQINSQDSDCTIYLKGIHHLEVESILQFIYHGEAKLQTERTKEFFSFAEDLEIQELSKILNEKQYDVKQKNCEQSNNHEIPETPSFPLGSQIDPNLTENRYSCNQCDKKYSSQSALRNHIEAKHEGILKYECSYCEYKTSRAWDLSKHFKRMHEFKSINEQLECSDCEYKTILAYDLSQHIKRIHCESSNCAQCDQQFSNRNKLNAHIRYVHKGIEYPCNQCDYVAAENYILSKHIQAVHVHDGHKYSCDQCDRQYSSQGALQDHTKAKHEGILKHECSECEYKTSRAFDLSKHVKRMHEFENINEQYECSDCDYKTRWACDLSKHVKTVHECDGESSCTQCDQQFSTRKKLSIHIRYVHKGIKYPCNQCDYEADENWILMGHIQRVHLNDGHKYSCDKCKQQFSTKNRLNTHICRIYPTKP